MAGDNQIVLNEHTLNNKKQMAYVSANEVSHASINNNRELELRVDKTNKFKPMLPWKEGELHKEKMFRDAYRMYLKRMGDYEILLKKKLAGETLTKMQKKKLDALYKALETYIIPQLGANPLTSLQLVWKKQNDKIILVQDPKNTEPADPTKHREYLAKEFFQGPRNKEIIEELHYRKNIGIYQNKYINDEKFADRLSDFESLSPDMRKLLGPELCALLSDFFQTEDHCRRVGWPTM